MSFISFLYGVESKPLKRLGGHTMKTATARAPVARKAAPKKVDIQKLTPEQLDALPEDVFMASLKPHVRKFAEGLFKLKGIK